MNSGRGSQVAPAGKLVSPKPASGSSASDLLLLALLAVSLLPSPRCQCLAVLEQQQQLESSPEPWEPDPRPANGSGRAPSSQDTATALRGPSSPASWADASNAEDKFKFPLYMRTLATLACVVIFTVGVCGNLLVPLVVIKTKYLRNSTNLFLINLSMADLLVLIVCMPTVLIELHSRPETWLLGEAMCKLSNFVEMLAANGSIFTILAISFERYYAICKPLKAGYKCTRLRATIIICLIWLLSGLLTSPILMMAKSSETVYIDGSLVYNCILETNAYWHKMYVFVSMFAFFCLPLLVLMLVYWLIGRRLIRETVAMASTDSLAATGPKRSRLAKAASLKSISTFFTSLHAQMTPTRAPRETTTLGQRRAKLMAGKALSLDQQLIMAPPAAGQVEPSCCRRPEVIVAPRGAGGRLTVAAGGLLRRLGRLNKSAGDDADLRARERKTAAELIQTNGFVGMHSISETTTGGGQDSSALTPFLAGELAARTGNEVKRKRKLQSRKQHQRQQQQLQQQQQQQQQQQLQQQPHHHHQRTGRLRWKRFSASSSSTSVQTNSTNLASECSSSAGASCCQQNPLVCWPSNNLSRSPRSILHHSATTSSADSANCPLADHSDRPPAATLARPPAKKCTRFEATGGTALAGSLSSAVATSSESSAVSDESKSSSPDSIFVGQDNKSCEGGDLLAELEPSHSPGSSLLGARAALGSPDAARRGSLSGATPKRKYLGKISEPQLSTGLTDGEHHHSSARRSGSQPSVCAGAHLHAELMVVRDLSKKQQMDSRRQVVVMLAFVVACFFLLFFPYRVFTIWLTLSTEDQVQALGMETYYNLTYFSRILIYLHSAINPIAYNLISTKFRRAFMSILLCRGSNTRRQFTTEHRIINHQQHHRSTDNSADSTAAGKTKSPAHKQAANW